MLAVIVSLNSASTDNLHSKILLAISVLLDILCILFSSISIYENKVENDTTARICHNRIEQYIHSDVSFDILSLHKGRVRNKLFLACEKLSYISFFLFIGMLTIYALHKMFFQPWLGCDYLNIVFWSDGRIRTTDLMENHALYRLSYITNLIVKQIPRFADWITNLTVYIYNDTAWPLTTALYRWQVVTTLHRQISSEGNLQPPFYQNVKELFSKCPASLQGQAHRPDWATDIFGIFWFDLAATWC